MPDLCPAWPAPSLVGAGSYTLNGTSGLSGRADEGIHQCRKQGEQGGFATMAYGVTRGRPAADSARRGSVKKLAMLST